MVSADTFLPSGDFLTEDECRTWVALGNRNYANIDVARECNMAKDNAAVVSSGNKPEVPMLMFISTGKGDQWREISYRFAENMSCIKTVELDCDHYVFHFEADKMAEYLIQNGIDPSRIIVENESLSTSENAVRESL